MRSSLKTMPWLRLIGRISLVISPIFWAFSPAYAVDDSHEELLAPILAGGEPESLAALQAFEEHVESLIEELTPATVAIRIGGTYGSAVIVSADGIILTAAHVIKERGEEATFIFPDGSTAVGITLGFNTAFDAGMARITDEPPSAEGWPHAELGTSSDLERGDWLLALGHPGGYEPLRLPVSRLGRVLHNLNDVICTDCLIVGGDSGGPLFNIQGEVIGIHSQIGSTMRENYHVPADAYHRSWERLVEGDRFHNYDGNNAHFGIMGSGIDRPVRVTTVGRNSPANNADIRVGDLITHFDGTEVPTLGHFMNQLSATTPGDEVVIELRRGNQEMSITLEIGSRGR